MLSFSSVSITSNYPLKKRVQVTAANGAAGQGPSSTAVGRTQSIGNYGIPTHAILKWQWMDYLHTVVNSKPSTQIKNHASFVTPCMLNMTLLNQPHSQAWSPGREWNGNTVVCRSQQLAVVWLSFYMIMPNMDTTPLSCILSCRHLGATSCHTSFNIQSPMLNLFLVMRSCHC